MPRNDKICTICGLRLHKLPQGTDRSRLYLRMENEIRASIFADCTIFQSGMAMGADMEGARQVRRLKHEFPRIQLHCFLPCETQADNWTGEWRELYFNLLEEADEVHCLQTRYSNGCMHRRNRAMVDKSQKLIAIHDNFTRGGTAYTIQYARAKGLEIITIDPLQFCAP